jgi:signal transduction histidine kinase
MSHVDGYDIMRYINENLSMTYVIVITGHANLESAIEAIHQKAFDYITKPFDFDTLRRSVEKAFNQLEIERFREDMLSMLTHDIRIPLQSIIGYASQIYDPKTDEFHPRAMDFLNNVCVYSQRVLGLVDNFLTSSKIESGRLFLCETQFDFNYFITDLVSFHEVRAHQHDITLKVDQLSKSEIFYGDESLLFRAVSNILNNAIKYSPKGSTVTVECKKYSAALSALGKDAIEISVINPGPGIPVEDLSDIFVLYKRAKNLRTIEGSGLGLFVVKSVSESHEGTVRAESIPYEKTKFTMLLPIRQPAAGETKSPSST